MSRRMWALAVSAWVAVVIAGSALTWVAINRAGDRVGAPADVSTTLPGVVSTPGTAPEASSPPSATPSTTPEPTRSTTPRSASLSPTPTGRPSGPTPKVSSPAVRTETRTWTGAAGFLTVSCTDRQAQLKGASPADGWSYEVGDASGDSVEVKFESGETETRVHATCERGTPQFQVESGTDGA